MTECKMDQRIPYGPKLSIIVAKIESRVFRLTRYAPEIMDLVKSLLKWGVFASIVLGLILYLVKSGNWVDSIRNPWQNDEKPVETFNMAVLQAPVPYNVVWIGANMSQIYYDTKEKKLLLYRQNDKKPFAVVPISSDSGEASPRGGVSAADKVSESAARVRVTDAGNYILRVSSDIRDIFYSFNSSLNTINKIYETKTNDLSVVTWDTFKLQSPTDSGAIERLVVGLLNLGLDEMYGAVSGSTAGQVSRIQVLEGAYGTHDAEVLPILADLSLQDNLVDLDALSDRIVVVLGDPLTGMEIWQVPFSLVPPAEASQNRLTSTVSQKEYSTSATTKPTLILRNPKQISQCRWAAISLRKGYLVDTGLVVLDEPYDKECPGAGIYVLDGERLIPVQGLPFEQTSVLRQDMILLGRQVVVSDNAAHSVQRGVDGAELFLLWGYIDSNKVLRLGLGSLRKAVLGEQEVSVSSERSDGIAHNRGVRYAYTEVATLGSGIYFDQGLAEFRLELWDVDRPHGMITFGVGMPNIYVVISRGVKAD